MIHCSEQLPEPLTEELPTAQPDVVYAHIVPSQETNLGNPNANDYEMSDSVVYSELLRNDSDTRGPSGDLYAQVQKRYTLYPPDLENNPENPSATPNDASVVYSELLRNDSDVHTADDSHRQGPSGDLYAEVQKRNTLYPP